MVQILDVVEDPGETCEVDELHDSLMDTLLDAQDAEVQTSDGHLFFIPREVEKLEVEKIAEEVE